MCVCNRNDNANDLYAIVYQRYSLSLTGWSMTAASRARGCLIKKKNSSVRYFDSKKKKKIVNN